MRYCTVKCRTHPLIITHASQWADVNRYIVYTRTPITPRVPPKSELQRPKILTHGLSRSIQMHDAYITLPFSATTSPQRFFPAKLPWWWYIMHAFTHFAVQCSTYSTVQTVCGDMIQLSRCYASTNVPSPPSRPCTIHTVYYITPCPFYPFTPFTPPPIPSRFSCINPLPYPA